ncbi:galactose oxidase [Auricularia subglabra TFB-10046 SS5]|nr:galactose oxidase [Auricularia subglabra TFB-10046 SS5]
MRNTPHLPAGHADPAPPTVMYWSRAPVHGLLPSRKFRAHTSTLVDSVAWVFGGCDEHGCSRDVYCLDIETFQWSHPDLAGDWPVPCRAHTATLVDGKRIFVFGGGANADYYDSLYILDTAQRKWSQVTVPGPKPIQRRAHTAVYYKGRIWVFGGGNGVRALNDVWALDVSVPVDRMRWDQVETHGKRPSPRGYHTANLVGQNMVVVGGSDGRECFQDIWVLNLDTFEWRNVNTEKSYRRLSHCATQVGSYLFVMGGHDSQKYTNELLLFNLITLQWESRPCMGRPPSVRAYQSAFLADSRLFVLGGFDGTSAFDDVHILDLAASAYLPQVTSFAMTAN